MQNNCATFFETAFIKNLHAGGIFYSFPIISCVMNWYQVFVIIFLLMIVSKSKYPNFAP